MKLTYLNSLSMDSYEHEIKQKTIFFFEKQTYVSWQTKKWKKTYAHIELLHSSVL